MVAMDLTAFRNDLTAVIDQLGDSGPVCLTRYGSPVAEIRSATPESERAYTQAILDAVGYVHALGIAELLPGAGIDTMQKITELADRHRQLAACGVAFHPYPGECFPKDQHSLTVDEALAWLYFGEDAPSSSAEIYEWFRACSRLQLEAAERGMATVLPEDNYDDGDDRIRFLDLVIAAGHTPESLAAFGVRALEQGVPLDKLNELLGEKPIPADVLAMPEYDDYRFRSLTRHGVSHAEALAVFRLGLDAGTSLAFAEAGVRTAAEIKDLIDAKMDPAFAQRAAREGLTPEQWSAQIRKIQHLRYRPDGLLPFSLLVEAAAEQISLTRWDNASLTIDQDRPGKLFHADRVRRMSMFPWRFIYPERVLDVARAGLSPSFVAAFGKLMAHRYRDQTNDDFADAAIAAHGKGLTIEMALAMCRKDSRKPKFTPDQLLAVLDEGLCTTATAHYLADQYGDPAEWIADLRERRTRQPATDEFLTSIADTPAWAAVVTLAEQSTTAHWAKSWLRGSVYIRAAIDDLLRQRRLDDRQVLTLLRYTYGALRNSRFLEEGLRDTYLPHMSEIADLARTFDARLEHASR
ncbi:hypothetical protein F5X71_34720 [Nocardia brasiliensis]|uniref:Uncharacterized protein n=1 Tax=Nocardia brasiliensis TaxID=37326 RepID=A0A6G9Y0Y5_NOCBR|nr:hypothetical protein [Nocardia brasiliensis]QIS06780.1 hypothetical protein F5X71_34720 [Nocardia brasiliensis]